MIVCLGWGSLIWRPENLPVRGGWQRDGPKLPIEFARESRDGRVTLVIVEGVPEVPVLWAELDVESLAEAKKSLAEREEISEVNLHYSVGYCQEQESSHHSETPAILEWAVGSQIDTVVWTALKPGFRAARGTVPTLEGVLDHLRSLDHEARGLAEEYVSRAPIQIRTPYRQAFEQEFGWTASGDG